MKYNLSFPQLTPQEVDAIHNALALGIAQPMASVERAVNMLRAQVQQQNSDAAAPTAPTPLPEIGG